MSALLGDRTSRGRHSAGTRLRAESRKPDSSQTQGTTMPSAQRGATQIPAGARPCKGAPFPRPTAPPRAGQCQVATASWPSSPAPASRPPELPDTSGSPDGGVGGGLESNKGLRTWISAAPARLWGEGGGDQSLIWGTSGGRGHSTAGGGPRTTPCLRVCVRGAVC